MPALKSLRMRLKRLTRRLMWVFSVLFVAWIVAVQAGFFAMRTPDGEWAGKMKSRGQMLAPVFLDVPDGSGRMIHAVYVAASDSLPLVVLVHGSPGSADNYLDYLADTMLTRVARLVAIDRPGFGYTQGFGRAEPSQAAQAAAVWAVVRHLSAREKVWLVGHSLGGPVIARFAMDYPEQAAGLVLVAASIDPEQEEHPWWQSAIHPPPLKWVIPKSLWASNAEIKPLEGELRKMLPLWEGVVCPVRVVHALDDQLVPVANADFAQRVLQNNPEVTLKILPDGDHFILWNRHATVKQELLEGLGH
ncbi:MAG: alpha/beta hydrolase [Saprospiraceae bacterium]|nr:alpha/beta hydrolase [Saprospiraceae bacterium]